MPYPTFLFGPNKIVLIRMAARTTEQTVSEIIRVLQEVMRRVRALEENARVLEAKQVSTDNQALRKSEEMRVRTEAVETGFKDLNTRLLKLENEVSNVKKYLAKVATKSEIEEFKNYLDLLSPLRTHYVTQTELRKVLEELKAELKK